VINDFSSEAAISVRHFTNGCY